MKRYIFAYISCCVPMENLSRYAVYLQILTDVLWPDWII